MSDPVFDMNQVAANIAIESVKQVADGFVGQMKRALQKNAAKSGELFGKYAENSLCFYRSVRTIIHRSEPTDLMSIYGHLRLRRHDVVLQDDDFLRAAGDHRCCVVTGTAGSGKSFLLRYLFCRMFEMPNAQIPVLIELRRLKDPSNITIQRLVDDSLSAFGLKMDSKVLGDLLENGRFAIFLDGLDELAPKTRRALEDAVMEFLKAARRNLLVVSSRPDQRFQGWPHFTQFSVERLGVEEATAIVRKLRIPQELKENFFAAIEKDTFGGKRELLEIPLFVYILILVFRDFAQVPGKIVLFYRFAFDVLYSKHDALKVGFERFRHTDLSIDDMERVVGCFCFITYMGHVFEFDEVKLAGFVREAAEIEQIEADPDDLLRDFMECLCLLQRDGLGIVFTHRTFQEYFCAHYLVNSTLVDLPKTLDDALLRMSNQVIGMAHALAEGKVEDEWLLPKVRQLRDRMELALDDDGAFLAHSSLEVRIDEGRVSFQHSMPYDLFEFVLAMRAFDLPVTILDGTVETVVGVPSSDFCQTASESGFVPINLQKADAASRSRMWLSKKGETQFLLAKEDLGWCDDLGLRNSIRQFRRQLTDAMLLFERAAERRSVGQKRIESFLRRDPRQ